MPVSQLVGQKQSDLLDFHLGNADSRSQSILDPDTGCPSHTLFIHQV